MACRARFHTQIMNIDKKSAALALNWYTEQSPPPHPFHRESVTRKILGHMLTPDLTSNSASCSCSFSRFWSDSHLHVPWLQPQWPSPGCCLPSTVCLCRAVLGTALPWCFGPWHKLILWFPWTRLHHWLTTLASLFSAFTPAAASLLLCAILHSPAALLSVTSLLLLGLAESQGSFHFLEQLVGDT